MNRTISKRVKEKLPRACKKTACMCGLEKVALTEQHQEKLQVCEDYGVRNISVSKRADKRRWNDQKEKIGSAD